jgi:regulator of nucleoside diphosphate kinase
MDEGVGIFYPPGKIEAVRHYPKSVYTRIAFIILAWILQSASASNYDMENKMYITMNDYQRLTGLVEFASLKVKIPEIVNRLYNQFKVAKMVSQERIAESVITMNSRVLVKEISNGREAEVTVTYPQDADVRERKVSVFSTIGVALLGRQVGDIVSWKVPTGTGQFEIVKVLYQPEAVGHYYL